MFGGPKHGYIGVDLGKGAVKVAQIERRRNRFELVDAAIIPHRYAQPTDVSTVPTTADEILSGLSLAQQLRGRQAAGVLSMTDCEFHAIRVEQRRPTADKVLGELKNSTPLDWRKRTFDAWPIGDGGEGDNSQQPNLGVISTRSETSNQAATALAAARLDCRAMDAGPTALGRAIRMMVGSRDVSLAALDWGYGNAVFCAFRQGVPYYVRTLKQCGFSRLVAELSQQASCSTDEALALLHNDGAATDGEETSPNNRVTRQVLRPFLERLAMEFQRTLQYLTTHRRGAMPQGVVMFGAGTTIRGISEQLTKTLGREVRSWSPHADALRVPEELREPIALFAPAIQASALAWEEA